MTTTTDFTEITAGNVATSTFIPVPEEGTVAFADVTVRVIDPNGVERALIEAIVELDDDGGFEVDYETPETGPYGIWAFRWETGPTPRIVFEKAGSPGDSTMFRLLRPRFTNP